VRRRNVMKLLAGAMASVPLAVHAQQRERRRRVGVLMNLAADDPEAQVRLTAFAQGLQELGWVLGRNLDIEYRWGAGDPNRYRQYAAALVAFAPDAILSVGGTSVSALQRESRTVPIVFAEVTDPINRGLVASLARPGGNTTGFVQLDFALSAKWLELLKQIAPGVTKVAVIRDPTQSSGVGQMAALQSVAPSFGVELTPVGIEEPDLLARAIAEFASANSGLIATAGAPVSGHRNLITTLALKHRLPAVYPFRHYVTGGGLMSYGSDQIEEFRQAAAYIDRILKGEKAADLPVQTPTKYELVINLGTAKALGLELPPTILARADEVIE
jgi:putative tryptophan/tyrosine transport system substrate-binding protein